MLYLVFVEATIPVAPASASATTTAALSRAIVVSIVLVDLVRVFARWRRVELLVIGWPRLFLLLRVLVLGLAVGSGLVPKSDGCVALAQLRL